MDTRLPFGLTAALILPGLNALAQSRPNILFILSDDHATKAISCYDGSLNHTPNIDALAEQGVRFTNCFCTNAISGPSRASILTGQMSHVNGVVNNSTGLYPNTPLLSKILQDQGYHTSIFGKWHIPTAPQGFDQYRILPGQGEYYNPDFIQNGMTVHDSGYVNDIVTTNAIDWLKQQSDTTPFLLMVHYKSPHRPWLPPLDLIGYYDSIPLPTPSNFEDDYQGRSIALQKQKMMVSRDLEAQPDLKLPIGPEYDYKVDQNRLKPDDRAVWDSLYAIRNQEYLGGPVADTAEWNYQRFLSDYLSTVKSMDNNIGKILAVLDSLGLSKNTIVVYTSDQGFFLGEHGWFDKRFFFEESARMPLIIKHPRTLPEGRVNEQLVENIDFAPTLLDMVGLDIPDVMQGKSFNDYIDTSAEFRDVVYYHYYEYPGPHSVARHVGIRTPRYKLIEYYLPDTDWELYDLESDPAEMRNLFNDPDYSAVRDSMQTLLRTQQVEFGDTNYTKEPAILKVENLAQNFPYVLLVPASPKYHGGSLTDGLSEALDFEGPGFMGTWYGFEGADFRLNMDLPQDTLVSGLTANFLNLPGSWIFKPKDVTVKLIDFEGKKTSVQVEEISTKARRSGGEIVYYRFKFPKGNYKEFVLVAHSMLICPDGHPGQGKPAWLFTDEIQIW